MTSSSPRTLLVDRTLEGTWHLDHSRSSIRFTTRTMWGLVRVSGAFRQMGGGGVVTPESQVHGTLTVKAASIDTKNLRRDRHLRSADFFDSDHYPDITFAVETVQPAAAGVTLTGTLSVRDCTRPLSFGALPSLQGEDELALDAELQIDRGDLGLTWGKRLGAGMSNTVTIHAVFTRR